MLKCVPTHGLGTSSNTLLHSACPDSTDLADGCVVALGADHLHFDTVHQTLQLLPYIPRPLHGAELDEVLITPLGGVAALHPLQGKDIRLLMSWGYQHF